MTRAIGSKAVLMTVLLLGGCVLPAGSTTVQVLPGKNKSPTDFASDQIACQSAARQQSTTTQAAAQQQATNTASDPNVLNGLMNAASVASAGQAAVQQTYDAAFVSCMQARGNVMPGPGAPTQTYATQASGSPLVHDVQVELIRVGMLKVVADGVYGPKTRVAISTYQQSNNLAVDGEPSEALLASLRQRTTPAGELVAPVTASAPVSVGATPANQLAAPVTSAPPPAATTDKLVAPVTSAPPAGTGNP